MTSAIWPQNVLLAKVFEPILQPWIGLSAALLSIMGSQQARSVPEKVACETLNALPGTVHCISAMIATSPKDKNTGLIPADATARPLYLSGDLYKLLVFLLAMIAHGRYSRYKGVSPWLAPDSSGATGMRPSTSSSSQQQRGGLQIAPYHVRLLRNSGLDHWKTPQRILDNFSTEHTLEFAAAALHLITAYRTANADTPEVMFRIVNPLSTIHEDGSVTHSTECISPAAAHNTLTGSSSSPPWGHNMILAAIECMALDADLNSFRDLLYPIDSEIRAVATATGSGAVVLPADTASELLQAVVQVVAPAFIHQMSSTAATTAFNRHYMLRDIQLVLVALIGQAPVKVLADCFMRAPRNAAVAVDAAFRAQLVQPDDSSSGAADLPAGLSCSAKHAVTLVPYTYRVVQAVHISSSPELRAGLMQQSTAVAQLLLTCLKCAGAAVAVCQPSAPEKFAGALAQVLHQAALTVHLVCALSNNTLHNISSNTAGGQSQRSRPAAGAGGDSSSNSNSQKETELWSVLTARSLLLLTNAAAQVSSWADRGVGSGAKGLEACTTVHAALSCQQMLVTARRAVVKLGEQLAHIDSLSVPAAVDRGSTSSTPPALNSTAGHDALAKLVVQQQEVQRALEEYLRAISVEQGGNAFRQPAAGGLAVSGSVSSSNSAGLDWTALQKQLGAFCTAVCAALPLSSCCNNPACLNLEKLSEQQLVGGKGCICAGCSVARYCGRRCQKQHWKQHKPACKKLSSPAS